MDRIELRKEQRTMLMTLHMHARDARSARPVLGDRFAADVLDRIDDTPSGIRSLDGNTPVICARARLIDDAARAFLDRHPDAVVLHLGCGLDSRVLRLDPEPGVTWFDVDQQPVIELRRLLYPERDGVTTVATSVTDPGWWSQVPSGRPRLVLAEGLLMYLTPEGVRTTVDHALDGAPACTLVADTVAPWTIRAARLQPAMRAAGAGFGSSTADLTAAARSHPGFTLRDETSVAAATAGYTHGVLSGFLRVFDAVPAGRRSMVLHTYATTDA